MNKENLEILNKLYKTQYYEFLRYAIGLYYYVNQKTKPYDITSGIYADNRIDENTKNKLGITSKNNKNRNIKIIAYKFYGENLVDVYKVVDTEKDYERKTFRNKYNEVFYAKDFFESIDQNLLWYILTGILALSDDNIKSLESKNLNGEKIFSELRPKTLNFIIGAGVNTEFGFANWNQLVDEIRKQIIEISHPVAKDVDELKKFEAKMLNTNYIAPQILKNLNRRKYYKTIYDVLYCKFDSNGKFDPNCNGKFDPKNTKSSYNSNLVNTNLYQVARICHMQKQTSVLTFNYDNLLELILKNNFTSSIVNSKYRYSKDPMHDPDINIYHPHGFYPYTTPKQQSHSLILSSYEYMDTYLSRRAYARKLLDEQLEFTNILLGNSLSDYEEQKVFFAHHKKYLSRFNYIFTTYNSSSNQSWMDRYKTIYYLKMGVIPVFFKNYIEMNESLKKL